MYGASGSGNKQELVERLVPLMDSPPPDLEPGSWYHYNKKETVAKLEEFCHKKHIVWTPK